MIDFPFVDPDLFTITYAHGLYMIHPILLLVCKPLSVTGGKYIYIYIYIYINTQRSLL